MVALDSLVCSHQQKKRRRIKLAETKLQGSDGMMPCCWWGWLFFFKMGSCRTFVIIKKKENQKKKKRKGSWCLFFCLFVESQLLFWHPRALCRARVFGRMWRAKDELLKGGPLLEIINWYGFVYLCFVAR